ncbi:ThiJ/PfpI family protein [Colletotrichum costaricense]|uniref:ThiJ/PfpI family protein n=1 Tax=Colletotrichum costaricense TaxID=1209916 RepID=A0AAI9YY52_9PEZI|nr:ThiJ/PfpI family protein [Colletotrichum costaricense]KAK1527349.1 ThiJ/PfpI family protein [Colletotrichum costaricense]
MSGRFRVRSSNVQRWNRELVHGRINLIKHMKHSPLKFNADVNLSRLFRRCGTHQRVPIQVAIPYQTFKDAGFDVNFATETGSMPRCDARMLEGLSQKFLGAAASTIKLHDTMVKSAEMQNPLSWTSLGFTLDDFDIVHIPGGHDKEVRQLMDSTTAQKLLADYFPQTKKPGKKIVTAICHGPLVLCNTKSQDGNSVLYHCTTTALPGCFESLAYHGTRLFLGDYYKTYGAGTENVEDSHSFVVEDTEYNYISARFPPDAAKLAEMTVNLAHLIHVQGFKGQDPTTA